MKNRSFIEIAGWVGVVLIVLAYALNNFGAIESQSAAYQTLNALGAVGIIIDGLGKKDLQPVVLNVIWLVIALIALVR